MQVATNENIVWTYSCAHPERKYNPVQHRDRQAYSLQASIQTSVQTSVEEKRAAQARGKRGVASGGWQARGGKRGMASGGWQAGDGCLKRGVAASTRRSHPRDEVGMVEGVVEVASGEEEVRHMGARAARTFLQLKTVAEMKDMYPLGDVAIESCATREQQEGLSRRGE